MAAAEAELEVEVMEEVRKEEWGRTAKATELMGELAVREEGEGPAKEAPAPRRPRLMGTLQYWKMGFHQGMDMVRTRPVMVSAVRHHREGMAGKPAHVLETVSPHKSSERQAMFIMLRKSKRDMSTL